MQVRASDFRSRSPSFTTIPTAPDEVYGRKAERAEWIPLTGAMAPGHSGNYDTLSWWTDQSTNALQGMAALVVLSCGEGRFVHH